MRAHHGPVRWGGIAVAAVVLLFWPDPTLSVLVWIGALVALYLGAVEWLRDQAPEPAPDAAVPAAGRGPGGRRPVPRPGRAPARGERSSPPAPAPCLAPPTATLVRLRSRRRRCREVDERLDLLVRLGAARDAGVLTDDEFSREKSRLLGV